MMNSVRNIIVRMPNWLGDAVMATAALHDLRKHYPEADITVMCLDKIAPLFKYDKTITELFKFTRPSGWLKRESDRDILFSIERGEYDLGVLFTNSFSSAFWFWRAGVKERLGYRRHLRSLLLTKSLPYPKGKEHQVEIYKMLLGPIGVPLSSSQPQLFVSEEEKKVAKELLKRVGVTEKSQLIGINPGAAFGTAKCWLPERFKELTLRLIQDSSVRVLYFGDPAGRSLVDSVCSDMPDQVVNLAGKTSLRELMALIQECKLFLTNDSGPMHIASALHVPLIALFGSTSDVKTGPYNGGIVLHKHVACSPCYKRVCPIDFRCMRGISVDEVEVLIKKVLSKGESIVT